MKVAMATNPCNRRDFLDKIGRSSLGTLLAAPSLGLNMSCSGALTHGMGHIIDIMATFVGIAGAEYPSTYNDSLVLPMEGTSLLPAFEGNHVTRDDPVFWQINQRQGRAVRQGRLKLVSDNPDTPWELFDIDNDRTEMNNLAHQNPGKVAELGGLFDSWIERCEKTMM